MRPLLRDVSPRVVGDRSQWGEGSILSEILFRIGPSVWKRGPLVEFGAADGEHLSNTAHLREEGWPTLLIEADGALAAVNLDVVWATVTPGNVNDWVPSDAAVVSIDVDGIDYEILCAMDARPAVIVCEHHPMVPVHVAWYGGDRFGCSAGMLVNWAAVNGYLPVAMAGCNTIMVRGEYADRFADVETDPRVMFDPSLVTFAVSDVTNGDYSMMGPWPFGRGTEHAGD